MVLIGTIFPQKMQVLSKYNCLSECFNICKTHANALQFILLINVLVKVFI